MSREQIIYRKVDELIPYENNPRKNDDAVDDVARSIEEFGFKVPIIIDKNDVIVAGHTRMKASKQLGLEEVPTIVASDLTDEQIKAFRLADNKVAEGSTWDEELLKVELDGLDNMFTGFSDDEMEILSFPEVGVKEREPKDKPIEMRLHFENINEFKKMEEDLTKLIREKHERARVSITGGEV